jgi:Uma2 family endonuclease
MDATPIEIVAPAGPSAPAAEDPADAHRLNIELVSLPPSLEPDPTCVPLPCVTNLCAVCVPCRVFGSDQRIATPDGLYTYPDAVVFCGPIELMGGRPPSATNPRALVEVLSDSTRDYDRGEKLDRYRAIPSLVEVLLVDPDPAAGVEHWVWSSRAAGRRWRSPTCTGTSRASPTS